MPAAARPGAEDRQRDARVPQNSSSMRDGEREARLVAHHGVGHEVHPVEADLGGLLDDRPRRLLALVPLLPGGADDGVGELVDPVAQLLLVVGQLEGELSHGRTSSGERKLPSGNKTDVTHRDPAQPNPPSRNGDEQGESSGDDRHAATRGGGDPEEIRRARSAAIGMPSSTSTNSTLP